MTDRPTLIRRMPWPQGSSRPVATPIQPSVVYASESPDALDAQYDGRNPGYTYAREGHPNADVLAARIDAMEGAEGGLVVGSGMAAVTLALLGALQAGDHVLGGDQLYGRSLRLMSETLPRMGIATSLADPTDAAAMEAAIRPTSPASSAPRRRAASSSPSTTPSRRPAPSVPSTTGRTSSSTR